MKTRLQTLSVIFFLAIVNVAVAQQVSTQAIVSTLAQPAMTGLVFSSQENTGTVATVRSPKSIESAWNTALATTVSSTTTTIGSSTNSSVSDSLSRKDDSALILTAFSLSQLGIGGKLWLTEQTAVKIGASANIGLALTLVGDFRGSQDYQQSQSIGQSTTRQQAQSNVAASARFANQSTVSLSCTIEKHVFQKRLISPFIGFGIGASVAFNSGLSGGGSGTSSLDTLELQGNFGGNGNQTQRQGSDGQQVIHAIDSYSLGAHVLVGVEYFVLPSISFAAQAGVSGNANLSYCLNVSNKTNVPSQNITPQAGQSKNSQVTSTQIANLNPTFGFSANTWFSISAQVYLGRGAAREMANAFLNIFSNW